MTGASRAVLATVARADPTLRALGEALPWIGGPVLAALLTCAIAWWMLKY